MASSLNFIAQQVSIYTGIPLFIAGILGGCLNIIVFLSLRTFRQSSCAFYLTISSFANIGQLITGLLSRIVITSLNIDWTQNSLFYCKTRSYFLNITSLICAACLCLATIDQYFATCTRVRWQQWCNIKLAHRLILICSIIFCIEQIPSIIFFNHLISSTTNQTSCTYTNSNYYQFYRYFDVLTLWLISSIIITVFFGSLAYNNSRQIAYRTNPLVRRELDKQLTVMVLVQVLVNSICLIPYTILYIIISNGSIVPTSTTFTQINFAFAINTSLFYVPYSTPFYVYFCASERFRRQFIHVIRNIYLKFKGQSLVTINQIVPTA